jgi:hypothetical protein
MKYGNVICTPEYRHRHQASFNKTRPIPGSVPASILQHRKLQSRTLEW